MRTVVVYESMFGNTKTIAEAIAEGLRGAGQVTPHASVPERMKRPRSLYARPEIVRGQECTRRR